MSLYQHLSYKTLLRSEIENRKVALPSRFSFQGAAAASGVQKTYLSKVFADPKTHLSGDQLFKIVDYLKLSDDDRRYVEILHRHERSQDSKRRAQLKAEYEALRHQKLKTHAHIESKDLSEVSVSLASEYYLDPNLQLLHMMLTVPALAKDIERQARLLHTSIEDVELLRTRLLDMGVLRLEGKELEVTEMQLHLKDSSALTPAYRKLLRLRSLEKSSRQDDYGFSVVFSANEKTRREAHEIFLEAITRIKKLVSKAPAESVYQINLDLLRWS